MTLPPLLSEKLTDLPHVGHAFFTRQGGVSQGLYSTLNFLLTRTDNPHHVAQNWALAAQELGLPPERLIAPYCVHGRDVVSVDVPFEMPGLAARPQVDGLITATPELGLGVTSADCVPLLLAAQNQPLVAALHAGWKGALSGVLQNALLEFERRGSTGAQITAALGPCIHQESYEVGEEVARSFIKASQGAASFFRPCSPTASRQSFLFDLPGYVVQVLEGFGVQNIDLLPYNTYTDEDRFFSCRRSYHQGEPHFGGHLSAIYLKPDGF